MKIGFDAKRALFNRRGLGNYSRDTIRIVASSRPNDEFFLFSPKEKGAISYNFPRNCEIITPQNCFGKMFPSYWRTKGICYTINDLDVEIYHGLSHELPVGIEKTKAKSVLTMHDLIFVKFPELYPFFDRKMYNLKYRRSCDVADKIIAISEQTKRDLVELWNVEENRISVVYQGCSPIFQTVVSEEKKVEVRKKYNLPEDYVLNVGAFEERKNQIRLIEAVATLNDVPLVFVGAKSKYSDVVEEAAISNYIQDRVFFINDVETNDLPAIYQAASLFVFPSLFEGFGIPVIEALFSGLPVIAATGSCLEESGGPGSIYVNPKDVEEIAFAIDKVLNDSELRKNMRDANIGHLEKFKDENIASKLFEIYKGL